ncbi:MAG: hypothetical protein CFE32_15635 [Alphaproteobacteria bacterium PA3]|nr:MAG: hypothetical protein CFE32_15635 [Alphaproteobacteria bacterium PA3]
MGLTIGVGFLAREARDNVEELEAFKEVYHALNTVLAEAGMPLHSEPLGIPESDSFDAQMLGYTGLHAIRRLAAYYVCEGRLPPPGSFDRFAEDPVTELLYQQLQKNLAPQNANFLPSLLSAEQAAPSFQHLMLHSDCEGFYLPTDFEHVIFDNVEPQRAGIGGMIGSAPRLLKECLVLAQLINLPLDLDIESEEMWEAADDPPSEGELWQIYGIEAFGIARLIRGCEAAIKHKAVLAFC